MISAGRRGDAVESFMSEVVGLPPDFVAFARTQPFWQAQEALAHTLVYDATIMRETARALADVIPDAQAHTLEGQEHNVSADALAPVLVEFFTR